MISQQPGRLHFSPALACVDCQQNTNQGLMYPTGSLVWQLLPLCDEHIGEQTEEPSGSDKPVSLNTLRSRINEQLAVVHHFQHKRRYLVRAYLYLRRQHAHSKTRRTLRIGLNRSSRRLAQMREEGPL